MNDRVDGSSGGGVGSGSLESFIFGVRDAEIVSAQRWSYQASTSIDPGERIIRHDCDIRICEHPHHHQPDTVARGRHANTSFGAPGRWVRFSLRLRDAVGTGDYTTAASMLATPEQLTFFNQPTIDAAQAGDHG